MKITSESLRSNWASIRILLIVLIGVFTGTGTIVGSSFSVFLLPVSKELNINRTEISVALTIFLWSGAIIGPFIAKLMDRFGVRKVIVPLTVMFGLTMISMIFAKSSKGHLYFQYLLIGLLTPSLVGYTKILALWFDKGRGTAFAVLVIGNSMAAGVMPKFAQVLINTYDWKTAYFCLGLMILLIAVPATTMLSEPKIISHEKQSVPVQKNGSTLSAALCSRLFWLITFGVSLITLCVQGIETHLVAILDERGVSANIAVSLFPAIALGTCIGQLSAGCLLDRFNSPRVATFFALISLGGLILFHNSNNTWVLMIACALLALGAFGEIGMTPYLVTRYFGLSSFATIYAATFTMGMLFFGASPVISGAIYDLSGSYRIAVALYMVLLATASLLLLFLRQYEYDRSGNLLTVQTAHLATESL